MNGITVAGSIIADVIYTIDKYPNLGLLASIDTTKYSIGGLGNLVLDLAKIDSSLEVYVSAVVGEDDYSQIIKNALLPHENIIQKNISVLKGEETSITIVVDSTAENQRTFFHREGVNEKFDFSHIDFKQNKIFHLEYLALMKNMDSYDDDFGTISAKTLKKAKELGMITSVDVVTASQEKCEKSILPALKYTDVCVINEVEASTISGVDLLGNIRENIAHALYKIKDLGVSKWVLVHTPKISFGLDILADEIVEISGINLPNGYIKGTTGAGDAYCAGVLYSLYQDTCLKEAMEFAQATAVMSLKTINGTDGILSYDEIINNYNNLRK